jgi:ankyrin repeat domain-containing protein 50
MALAVRGTATLKPEIRLAQALSEYEAILPDSEKAEMRKLRAGRPPDVSAVMEMTAAIDRTNRHRTSRRCFGPRLTNVLESVQQFSTIVDVIIGGSQNLIASAIWGTVKMTLQITSSFASYFDNLSALFMRIGQSCPRYREYGLLYPKHVRLQHGLCDYFCTIINLCKKAVLFIRKPFVAQLSSAILNPFRTDFGPLETKLSAYADTIREEASLASQQELSVETREASSFRSFFSGKTAHELQQAKMLRSQGNKFRFLDACATYNHQMAWKRARKAGTSRWLTDTPEYKQWAHASSSDVFWCIGKLGSGKTVCAASLVEQTIVVYPNALVAYFFCAHDDAESLKARVIVGSITRQLLNSTGADAFDSLHQDDFGAYTEEEIVAILLHLLSSCTQQCFVFVDGLDECDERELNLLLGALKTLLQSTNAFHVFCSSRPDIYLKHQAALRAGYKVSLPEENPDIGEYIDAALEDRLEAGILTLGDPSIILAVRNALLKGSQGM